MKFRTKIQHKKGGVYELKLQNNCKLLSQNDRAVVCVSRRPYLKMKGVSNGKEK
jgi:hypothetical protein